MDQGAADLEACYKNRFSRIEKRRQRVWQVLAREFFQKWVKPTDRVLDFGAGYCEFINNIAAAKKIALDMNPTTASHAGADIDVVCQDLTLSWQLEDDSIDVAFSSNFLEHLATKSDVLHCFKESRRVLVPGGKIILLGPNIRFCPDVYWDFLDHRVPLSDRSIVEALELSNFKILQVTDRFLPYTMQGKMPAHPVLVRLYLSLPIAWPIFGRQFLVVAQAQ